jgi:hypothetical protein
MIGGSDPQQGVLSRSLNVPQYIGVDLDCTVARMFDWLLLSQYIGTFGRSNPQ